MTAPVLRHATAADVDWLRDAMVRYCDELGPGASAAEMAGFWAQLDPAPVIVETGGDPVGFVCINGGDDADFMVCEFWIAPEHRKRGLGRATIERLLSRNPGSWQLGVIDSPAATGFWAAVLTGCPHVTGLRQGPPAVPMQALSYTFEVPGQPPAPNSEE